MVRRVVAVRTVLPWLLASAGCGLILDADPPSQSGGVDGSTPSDAGAPDARDASRPPPDGGSCANDSECDDALPCNGVETCFRGNCVAGPPPACPDDGIDCTDDHCDDATGGCVSQPDDTRCASPACGVAMCDPAALGCAFVPHDADCDDGIACTGDVCTGASCEHIPDTTLCMDSEYCDAITGCTPLPACVTSTDCPDMSCNFVECNDGACTYIPLGTDPDCTSADPCMPARCVSGSCVLGPRRICAPSDPRSCTREVCARDSIGDVSCTPQNRDGETCDIAPMRCAAGQCSGSTCVDPPPCTSPDACVTYGCGSDGVCVPVGAHDCGPSAYCVGSGVMPRCECFPGYIDCLPEPGCECAVFPECPVDFDDCDGDGVCECDLATQQCIIDPRTLAAICAPLLACERPCASDQLCCPTTGMCFAAACLACCPASA
jgi:hypothetical protein